MADSEEIIKTCDECGAAVYPDHLEQGTAGKVDGRLLCPLCYKEAQRQNEPEEAEESIALVEDQDLEVPNEKEQRPQIRTFGQDSVFGQVVDHDESKYKRALNLSGRGAIRCRTFHAKLTDSALAYVDTLVNAWTDKNPQIEIKHATSTIGMFEGKQHSEPHLILTIFY